MSIKLPDGVTIEMLKENWDKAQTQYTRAFRKMQLLDATDRDRLWEAIKAKFPEYQILPHTNHVTYVKENIHASIYTVGKLAQMVPSTEEDAQAVVDINILLNHLWHKLKVGKYQMEAGDRAALLNLGITQVGWDNQKKLPVYKNIPPTSFMRDPFAEDLDSSAYCMTWEELHKSVVKGIPMYKDTAKKVLEEMDAPTSASPVRLLNDKAPVSSDSQYVRIITHWIRHDGGIAEIHTVDNKGILKVIEKIEPDFFPFAMLYCNLPAGDPVGTSPAQKIFANSLAYNLMNSIFLTNEYKNQRPPKFIDTRSGINLATFLKHGNDSDYTFSVNGDVSKAVHYHQFPSPSPQANSFLNGLLRDVQMVTGVTDRYTGKETGSILTTGGMEAALEQATLIDTPKINNYESYTERLTSLTLNNIAKHGASRKYFIKNPDTGEYSTIEVDFGKLDQDTLDMYELHISSELPKNKARLAQTANVIMEKQLQYAQSGKQVDLLTPEEWLMLQDLPIKEYMQKRMGMQRSADYMEKVSRVISTFTGLAKAGVPPEEALEMTAQAMQGMEMPGGPQMEMPQPEMGMEMPPQEDEMMY
jgi:hypothetical protein